jgi:phosphoribosylanthranilate isomerase
MTTPWVKICGITNKEDALEAIRLGANALGFNLWSGSKRHISIAENGEWISELPGGVERVAVLVNAPMEEALRVASHPGIDAVQFHGTENAAYLAEFAKSGHAFIVALRLEKNRVVRPSRELPDRVLIEAAMPGEYGGTGLMVDLDMAARFVEAERGRREVILAGGLTPENVQAAISKVRPFGVDVASGVEEAPRRKDWGKLQRFIAAVRGHRHLGSQ